MESMEAVWKTQHGAGRSADINFDRRFTTVRAP